MIKAKYITRTQLNVRGGSGDKDRWECPVCRKNPKKAECRFNLSPKKRGSTHKCRFCKTKLLLDPFD